MTTAMFFNSESTNLKFIKVNGRKVYVRRIESLEQGEYSWEWVGKAGGTAFKIFGGRASGGRANEWFVQWDTLGDFTMNATSFTHAVRLIETA